ncbi:Lysophospholipase 1, partial [Ascosphaera atra]
TKTTPLIVYLPNAPYSHYTNVSTFDLKYKDEERDAIITNGYNVATRGNNTEDSKWSQCVACAMLHRSFARTNTTVPDTCTSCYQKYCWDGKENNTSPASYYPSVMIQSDDDSAAPRMGPSAAAVVAAIAVLVPALL